MFRYVAGRLGQGILSLIALTLIVFFSARLTGDPALNLLSGADFTPENYERMREVLGLDKSLAEQYQIFISNAARGELGTSFVYHGSVTELIFSRLPATFQLATAALAFSLPVGIVLGVFSSLRRDSRLDRGLVSLSVLGMSAPQFWVAIMLITVFAGSLRLLPATGNSQPGSLILPTLTLSLYLIAVFMRLVRSSMGDVLVSDFIRFARLKGLSQRQIVWKHSLKNALIPLITFAGVTIGALLNGSIVVEQVFGWPGVGSLTLGAAVARDFPLLQGTVLFAGMFYILASLVTDLLYAFVDPRIQHQGEG